ncbi:peptidylprolyl isomerase [Cohnella silvisoli]|uniref:peptidylprolyl isomerase n=1 Tax=Cohnella silvisoli TaxID=2873699 RepID=A0ABV1L4T1_9BACL|nr:peptidylprolyl isomerase [Cohnella silvisoli]MCD9026309.1 peptidylprolyl isomerase [Cohnella silvisoli]
MRETIRYKPVVLLALLATVFMTSGCQSDPLPTPSGSIPRETIEKDEIVATAGNVSITRRQLLDKLISSYGAQTLRSMMLTEVVNEEAIALQIAVTDDELEQELSLMKQGYEDEQQFYKAMEEQLGLNPEEVREDARYRLLLEKLAIHHVTVTESEIDRYLEEHRKEFQPLKKYQIAQIVVEKKEQAQGLLSQLADGADFGVLARKFSLDEFSADAGGDLGWVEDQDPFVAPGVLQAVADMHSGQVTGPIKTDQGYVIVQLNGRSVEKTKTDETIRIEVRRQIALGKAVSMKDMEQALLKKYNAQVIDPSLRP